MINVDFERQTSTPHATAGFLDCLCSGVTQHDWSLIALPSHLTWIPKAPMSVRLTCLQALPLSRYLWIEAIIHVLASCKCHVNIPRDTSCHGFTDRKSVTVLGEDAPELFHPQHPNPQQSRFQNEKTIRAPRFQLLWNNEEDENTEVATCGCRYNNCGRSQPSFYTYWLYLPALCGLDLFPR